MNISRFGCIAILVSFFIGTVQARPSLEEKLPVEDGVEHFEFSTKKYCLTVSPNGVILIKDLQNYKKENKEKDVLEFLYSAWYKDRKKSEKGYYLKKLETKSKKSSSSFSLILKGELENKDPVTVMIQGDRNKLIFSTEATINPEFYFRQYFRVPEAKEEYLKGALMKVSKKKETIVCKEIYDTNEYRNYAKAVVMKGRHPLDAIFEVGKSEGEFRVAQYSHYAGSHLNDPFHVTYMNSEDKWLPNKNTFTLTF